MKTLTTSMAAIAMALAGTMAHADLADDVELLISDFEAVADMRPDGKAKWWKPVWKDYSAARRAAFADHCDTITELGLSCAPWSETGMIELVEETYAELLESLQPVEVDVNFECTVNGSGFNEVTNCYSDLLHVRKWTEDDEFLIRFVADGPGWTESDSLYGAATELDVDLPLSLYDHFMQTDVDWVEEVLELLRPINEDAVGELNPCTWLTEGTWQDQGDGQCWTSTGTNAELTQANDDLEALGSDPVFTNTWHVGDEGASARTDFIGEPNAYCAVNNRDDGTNYLITAGDFECARGHMFEDYYYNWQQPN